MLDEAPLARRGRLAWGFLAWGAGSEKKQQGPSGVEVKVTYSMSQNAGLDYGSFLCISAALPGFGAVFGL